MKDLFEKYLNKDARILLGGLGIYVKIVDVKISYGKPRYRVLPHQGDGAIWVENVELINKHD